VGPALAQAKAAGWTVIVKEALANGRLAVPSPATSVALGAAPHADGSVASAATVLGERPDATALAAALAQPWADVVLSGAATVAHLESNLAAVTADAGDLARFEHLAVDPATYWRQRGAMAWT
jgi:aryl-alcohol dehydrogenase-like predicted oxidoreductase